MNKHQGKRFAERAARVASETVEAGRSSAQKLPHGAQQNYFAAVEGVRDFNVRLLEMAHANTLAALDLVREISSAKEPSAAASLWSAHLRQHFETLTEQSRELTARAQRIAVSSAEPLMRGFGNGLKGTT
jgi:hypothetical protein